MVNNPEGSDSPRDSGLLAFPTPTKMPVWTHILLG